MKKKSSKLSFPSEASIYKSLLVAYIQGKDEFDRVSEKYEEEIDSKLLDLCKTYGIPETPDMYYKLSIELARELYPERKRNRRKQKWNDIIRGALVVEIERLKNSGESSHSVKWAANKLAKSEPWSSFLEEKDSYTSSPDPGEALRVQYYKSKDTDIAENMRRTFKNLESNNLISEWKKQFL